MMVRLSRNSSRINALKQAHSWNDAIRCSDRKYGWKHDHQEVCLVSRWFNCMLPCWQEVRVSAWSACDTLCV